MEESTSIHNIFTSVNHALKPCNRIEAKTFERERLNLPQYFVSSQIDS